MRTHISCGGVCVWGYISDVSHLCHRYLDGGCCCCCCRCRAPSSFEHTSPEKGLSALSVAAVCVCVRACIVSTTAAIAAHVRSPACHDTANCAHAATAHTGPLRRPHDGIKFEPTTAQDAEQCNIVDTTQCCKHQCTHCATLYLRARARMRFEYASGPRRYSTLSTRRRGAASPSSSSSASCPDIPCVRVRAGSSRRRQVHATTGDGAAATPHLHTHGRARARAVKSK